jgi:hypothetical protein
VNNRQLTIAGLKACGWREVTPAPTRKYVTFERAPTEGRMFVGKSGALRFSSGGVVCGSRSLTNCRLHRSYQEVGNPAYKWPTPQYADAKRIEIMDGMAAVKIKL